MASIDRTDWHSGNDFPSDLPEENGGTHIGMYLNWIIENDLVGELHRTDSKEGLEKVKTKEITGRDFLFLYCDGKFTNEDLNEVGLEFTEKYYSSNRYFNDYSTLFIKDKESIYRVENNWENYSKIQPILDARFEDWNGKRSKKFWEFWK